MLHSTSSIYAFCLEDNCNSARIYNFSIRKEAEDHKYHKNMPFDVFSNDLIECEQKII